MREICGNGFCLVVHGWVELATGALLTYCNFRSYFTYIILCGTSANIRPTRTVDSRQLLASSLKWMGGQTDQTALLVDTFLLFGPYGAILPVRPVRTLCSLPCRVVVSAA